MFESKFMLSSVIASVNARLLGTAERLLNEERQAEQELHEQRELEGGAMREAYGTQHLDVRNEDDGLLQDDPYDNHGRDWTDTRQLLRAYADMRLALVEKLASIATSFYDRPQSLASTMAFMIGKDPDGKFRDAAEWATEQVEREAKDGRYQKIAEIMNEGGEEIITEAAMIEAAIEDRVKQIGRTRHNAAKIVATAEEALRVSDNSYDNGDFTDLVTNLPAQVRDAFVEKLGQALTRSKARCAKVALKNMTVAMEEIAALRLDTAYVLTLKHACGEAYRAEQAPQEEVVTLTPQQKAAATRKRNKEAKQRQAA